MMDHKLWLESEYQQWVQALQSLTVYNFKEHPQVKRMLGEIEWSQEFRVPLSVDDYELIEQIDNIGRRRVTELSGVGWRMVYYANIILYKNPPSIIEIGGGAGEFYAILRALGYKGEYYICDLPEVKLFQYKYLREVRQQTGLALSQLLSYDFCVSFYALGEFDDETKEWYIRNVINKCPHGFIIWNPHSGASDTINFRCTIQDEYPLLAKGNKQLEW